jgi:lipopolysaccharide transport system permease protein
MAATMQPERPPAIAAGPETAITIEPPTRWGDLRLREIWAYRELLYFLTKREVLIRYKQSLLGVGWAVVQPIAMTAIFWLFFGRLANIPSEGVPYPVFALAALVPWTFVSQGVAQAATSLVADQNLVSKVYFPRLVIPIAKVFALTLDVLIALAVFVVVALASGVSPTVGLVAVPGLLALAALTAFGAGTLLAALNVRYRDVTVLVPLLVQMWLFATPVVYPASLVTGVWQYLYALNPAVTVITGFRWAFLDTPAPELGVAAISAASALALAGAALLYFRRTERYFADIL